MQSSESNGVTYLTLPEFAWLLEVTPMTVRNWMRDRKLRYFKAGHVIRIAWEEFERFFQRHTILSREDKPEDLRTEFERIRKLLATRREAA